MIYSQGFISKSVQSTQHIFINNIIIVFIVLCGGERGMQFIHFIPVKSYNNSDGFITNKSQVFIIHKKKKN